MHGRQHVQGRPPSSTAIAAWSAGSTSWRAAGQLGLCRALLADRQTVHRGCLWEGCSRRDLPRVRCQPGPALGCESRISCTQTARSPQTVLTGSPLPSHRVGIDSSRTRQTMTSSGTHWSSPRSSGCACRPSYCRPRACAWPARLQRRRAELIMQFALSGLLSWSQCQLSSNGIIQTQLLFPNAVVSLTHSHSDQDAGRGHYAVT